MQADNGFIDLVRQMRDAQKKYFATKQGLELCKWLERQTDQYLDNLLANDLFASNGIFGDDTND